MQVLLAGVLPRWLSVEDRGGMSRYLAARQFLGIISLPGPKGLTAVRTPPHVYIRPQIAGQMELGPCSTEDLLLPESSTPVRIAE